eukprot:131427-Rhodomonas_salina.1
MSGSIPPIDAFAVRCPGLTSVMLKPALQGFKATALKLFVQIHLSDDCGPAANLTSAPETITVEAVPGKSAVHLRNSQGGYLCALRNGDLKIKGAASMSRADRSWR